MILQAVNPKRKTGYYWVKLEDSHWMVAKYWQTYGWWTQMNPILDAKPGARIVYVHEHRLEPPEILQSKPNYQKRVRTIKPKRIKRIRTIKPKQIQVKRKRTK